ncbi:hypothetical protein [Bradyrhizobium sp. ERR14]|uniref:hypothetical protein n=1 Tax=Bradyrhizobium sp. ERR14 TaxID=2663837 RepID=UPI0016221DE1|nr:hypothetical protein [Bradyrhizobium sp. ERR14]MBB4396554.1 hypothetical protein [Bradyrhizobium sp. ERR14]
MIDTIISSRLFWSCIPVPDDGVIEIQFLIHGAFPVVAKGARARKQLSKGDIAALGDASAHDALRQLVINWCCMGCTDPRRKRIAST